MNNKHILDLTLRLSQGLDQNYDVVSMETVLSVISALEGTTITKEQLEATRLAKYINQLRRRTKCENLARRAKSLLKRWREMVGIQQSNDISVAASGIVNMPAVTAITSTESTPFNIPVSDNAVCTSHLINPQFSHQHYQYEQQQNNVKQHQVQQHPYHSQPSSPVNLQKRSNPNEYLISLSNPATDSQMQRSTNINVRKKRRLDKNKNHEPIPQHQQQPTSFANLITGLGSTFGSSQKTTRDKNKPVASIVKPVETFIIEHSSNSNSDLICIPSNNTVSNITSATDVPPVVIDLQDTNSSMNSLVSKDVNNASSSFYRNKNFTKKSKKEKKRKDRNTMPRQNQPLQDCDDQNTTTASYPKRPSNILLLDEKSHSAYPTNISEILSLSNSSISSVFPSAEAMSKNVFQSDPNELFCSSTQKSKSDLTFAGKFKRNSNLPSTGSNVLNYNSDSMNVNILNNNFPNQNKFSIFDGIGPTNSNDSSSGTRTLLYPVDANNLKIEANNSTHNIEDVIAKNDMNEKSLSNMSNKGNSLTDNAFAVGASPIIGAQQQQSIDLTTINFPVKQAGNQPKKRGRKKGSKGVDSVMAKEISLSSQMLISSIGVSGKRVKTTKELYAEIEKKKLRNIKLGGGMSRNSSANCTGQKPVSSRRPSFCSDIVESDSCTMTSELSRDSGNNLSKTTIGKRETPTNNNSNYSKQDSEFKTGDVKRDDGSRYLTECNTVLEKISKLKLELQEILKSMIQVPSVAEIEYECFNSITPCTCTIEEVDAPTDNESIKSIGTNNSKDSNFIDTNSTNISEKGNNKLSTQQQIVANKFKNTDKGQDALLPQPPPPTKVKKSIFDLDYDDDEDPLHSIIADIVGKNCKAETEIIANTTVIEEKPELPLSFENDIGKLDHPNTPYALDVSLYYSDNIIFPTYEIKFDPDCRAKDRFEVQTQKITKFHVDTLHNCFIPNVNGNWNHVDIVSIGKRIKDEDSHKDMIVDGNDVVPFYGSDMNEQIVKNLSNVKFTTKFQVKHSKRQNQNEILYHIPFLGISRIPDVVNTKFYKDVKRLTLDEEKENVDNKLHSKNIIFNTSALDTIDAKEIEEMGMDSKLNVETISNYIKLKANKSIKKSGFRRTKKHATLVKRSTFSRLNLAVSGNLEINTSVLTDSDNVEEFKLHKSLFYHEEIYPVVRSDSHLYKECIFNISSCSSGCSSTDEETTNESLNCRKLSISSSSSLSLSSSDCHTSILKLQQQIIETEVAKRAAPTIENNKKNESDKILCSPFIENDKKNTISEENVNNNDNDNADNNDGNLSKENNHMLLSFNNIYSKTTRDENAEQENKDHESFVLNQQLQNCDDYNLNNNFNIIKYIDNKSSSVKNNNNNSCSNNYSDTNFNISSSSCSHDNSLNYPLRHHKHNDDNDVQLKPLKEYQIGIRAVDEDVNDDDGNNCGRLQQFKEWHEVLQLRSYNDEILTVLPYVVLD